MTGRPDSLGESQEAETHSPDSGEMQDDSGRPLHPNPPQEGEGTFAVPRWARPAGEGTSRAGWRGWRATLRRRLLWPAVVVLVLFAVWSNYPFIPNPWVALFRQPDGDASATSAPGRWAMYGADPSLTNFIPQARAPQGIVAYTVKVDGGVRSAAAVDGGVLYVGGQSRIAAYAADNGELLWEQPVNGPAHGAPAVAGDLVYLGMLGKQVLALHPGTGSPVWEYKGDAPFPGTVTVQDGILYAASRGGQVHSLDALTGDLLWKMDAGSALVAPVAVADGRMFAASTAGLLYIRNARTGDKQAPHPHRRRAGCPSGGGRRAGLPSVEG